MSDKNQNRSKEVSKELEELKKKRERDDREMEEKYGPNRGKTSSSDKKTESKASQYREHLNQSVEEKRKERNKSVPEYNSESSQSERKKEFSNFDKPLQKNDFTSPKSEVRSSETREVGNEFETSKESNTEISKQFTEKNISDKYNQKPLGKWKTASSSVIGKSHVQSGAPCQDATSKLESVKEEFYGLALADGAGSCIHSEKGSQLITEKILSYIKENFDKIYNIKEINEIDIKKIFDHWDDGNQKGIIGQTPKMSDLFYNSIKEDFNRVLNRDRISSEIKKFFIENIKKEFDKNLLINQSSDSEIKNSFISGIERKFTEIFNIEKVDWLNDQLIQEIKEDLTKIHMDESNYNQMKIRYSNLIKQNFERFFKIEEERYNNINRSFLKLIKEEQRKITDNIKEKYTEIKDSFIHKIDSQLNEISPSISKFKKEGKMNTKIDEKLEKIGETLKQNYQIDYKLKFLKYFEGEYKKTPLNQKEVSTSDIKNKWKENLLIIDKTYKKTEKDINNFEKRTREELKEKIKNLNSSLLDRLLELLTLGLITTSKQDDKINKCNNEAIQTIENKIDHERENLRTQINEVFQEMFDGTIDKSCKKIENYFFQDIKQKLNQIFNLEKSSNQFKEFFLNDIKQQFDRIFKIDRTYNKFRAKFLLQYIENQLEKYAIEKEYKFKDLSSTLLFVVVKKKKYVFGHIGDGVIGTLDNQDNLQVISLPENGEYANSTFFTTTTSYKDRLRIKTGALTKTTGFILMSDGAGEGLYDTRKRSLGSINRKIINYLKNNESSQAERYLEKDLNEIKSKKTTDDCSIGIMRLREGMVY